MLPPLLQKQLIDKGSGQHSCNRHLHTPIPAPVRHFQTCCRRLRQRNWSYKNFVGLYWRLLVLRVDLCLVMFLVFILSVNFAPMSFFFLRLFFFILSSPSIRLSCVILFLCSTPIVLSVLHICIRVFFPLLLSLPCFLYSSLCSLFLFFRFIHSFQGIN